MHNANPAISSNPSKLQFDFRFGVLFPWTFRFLGALAAIGALFLLLDLSWPGIPLLIIGLVVVFANEGAEIDHQKKVYREYTSFLLLKTGRWIPYDSIEKVYINRKLESLKMYTAHTSKSATFKHEVYDAYLKFSSGERILLLSKKNKDALLMRLQPFIQSLQIQILDNT